MGLWRYGYPRAPFSKAQIIFKYDVLNFFFSIDSNLCGI